MHTYSYDVFDTSLVRTYAKPTMLFHHLAARLLPPGTPPADIAQLAALRVRTEWEARQTSPNREVTLAGIYAALVAGGGLPVDSATMMELELELEQQCLRPVPMIREEIAERRQQGARILFVSDMYLPAAFIREQLLRHGIALPEDPVYVSNDVGCSKHSGELLREVLRREGLRAEELTHTGDNPAGDVAWPRRLGIPAVEFAATRLSTYEGMWSDQDPEPTWEAAFAAGAARLSRLEVLHATGNATEARLVGNIIAPVLTAAAAWALNQARQDGIRRLYFVARDGELPLVAARLLAQEPDAPEVRYLYGSRRAWFLPSTLSVDRSGLDWLCPPNTDRSLGALLARLGQKPDSMQPLIEEFGLAEAGLNRDLTNAEMDRFWAMVEDPRCSARIRATIDAARNRVLGYLEQEGVFDGTPSAMVDLGWSGRCQQSLNQIIQTRDPACALRGYYFALSAHRVTPDRSGPKTAWFVEEASPTDPGLRICRLIRNRALVEQCIANPSHPSTRDYQQTESGWRPVFAPFRAVDELQAFQTTVRLAIARYAEELRDYLRRGGALPPVLDSVAHSIFRFVITPARDEAALLQWVKVTNDPHEQRFDAVVRPFTLVDMMRLTWGATYVKARPKDLRNIWLEGCASLSPWWVRYPLRWLLHTRRNSG